MPEPLQELMFENLKRIQADIAFLTTAVNGVFTEMRAQRQDMFDLNRAVLGLSERMDRVEGRPDQMNARFDRLEARLDQIDAKFDRQDGRLERIERRLGLQRA